LTFPKLHNDSYETPIDDPLVQTFHAATKETEAEESITGWNVSCDARLFAKIGDMPTVVFGPGDIQDAHSAAEKIRLSEIITAAETLIRFTERWCVTI
jgi:acetylornithine deacetylase/succinyl-diaminopimelate desuccinylase-like protein